MLVFASVSRIALDRIRKKKACEPVLFTKQTLYYPREVF